MTDKEALTQLFGEHTDSRINHSLKTADGFDVYTVVVGRNEKPKRFVLPMPYGADYDDPDDLPVIPKAVGEWIKDAKAGYYELLDAMTKWTLDQPVFDWIHDNSDTFARAWLLGVWRVEENGEIVKLEAEK